MKVVALEQNSITLPDNLKWITSQPHSFKDLLNREIYAIEDEIENLELMKKTIVKKRKQEQKNKTVFQSLCKSIQSSMGDASTKQVGIFKQLKRTSLDNLEDLINGKKEGTKGKHQNGDEEDDEEDDEDDEKDEKGGKDGESGKEDHKKRKYVINVKKCDCCGLEVKRHVCKHTVCEKPCTKEEKQLLKKKEKKGKGSNHD